MKYFNIEALPVKISYVRQTQRDGWDCDQWCIEVSYKNQRGNGYFSTDYFTGLGLRKKPRNSWVESIPNKPKVADVLQSLFLDADASNYNFDDWCDNFGYSNDSICALNTYKHCLETATLLRKAFDTETTKLIHSVIDEM